MNECSAYGGRLYSASSCSELETLKDELLGSASGLRVSREPKEFFIGTFANMRGGGGHRRAETDREMNA